MFAYFFYFFVLVFGPPMVMFIARRRFPAYKTAISIAFGLWAISLVPAVGAVGLAAFQVEAMRQTARSLGGGLPCAALVETAAAQHGLDPFWLGAVVQVESNCDPNAISDMGAKGMTQIMPVIIAWCGGLTDPYDPVENLECGASFLAYLVTKYEGNMDLALAAYYAGEPAIDSCGCVAGHWHYVALVRAAHERLLTAASQPRLRLAQPYGDHTWRIVGNGYHGAGPWPGRDLSAGQCGVPVFAPLPGRVTEKGVDYLGNTYLVIRQGIAEAMMMHGHYTAEIGDLVTLSTRVGYDASEGYSSGCHTHLALHINGQAVDPLPFLEE